MALPKISQPTFSLTIPSTGKKTSFRPMLVKEEKVLLMAKEGKDTDDILASVKQVVNNCCLDESIDVNKLAMFDIEYLFLHIRSFSVGSKIKVSYRDNEDDIVRDFEVDISEVEVKFPEFYDRTKPYSVKLNDDMALTMKYPPGSLYSEALYKDLTESEVMDMLLINCLDKLYEKDKAIEMSTHSKEEILEFIDSLSISTFEKIKQFITETPKLEHIITYTNEKGKEKKIYMNTLSDFFILR